MALLLLLNKETHIFIQHWTLLNNAAGPANSHLKLHHLNLDINLKCKDILSL